MAFMAHFIVQVTDPTSQRHTTTQADGDGEKESQVKLNIRVYDLIARDIFGR